MEGGNKLSVSLEAPLDVSSSDMLVPVSQPTFQHNWQRFQGKFLPNSLRFEHNGWAAGWCVYELEYDTVKVSAGNGRYAGRVQLNDNPTYMLSLYASEESSESLHTVKYNDCMKVVSVDKGTASVSSGSSGLEGEFGDIKWKLSWSEEGASARLLEPASGVSLEASLNSDCTHTFVLTDTSTQLKVDLDLWLPGSLSGPSLQAQNFTKYLDGKCWWGDFCYDVKSGTVTVPNGKVTGNGASVSDGNLLKFSFAEEALETMSLKLDLKDTVIEFKQMHFEKDDSNENALVVPDSATLASFNKLSAQITPKDLKAGDENGIMVQAKVCAWLSLSAHVSGLDNGSVKKPDNIEDGMVQVFVLNQGQKATAVSVFGETETTEYSGSGESYSGQYGNMWTDDLKKKAGWRPVKVKGRYCTVSLTDAIGKGSGWQPYKYSVRKDAWCFSCRKFTNLRTPEGRAKASKLLGNAYSIGSCQHDYTADFGLNDVWEDTFSGPLVTEKDISDIQSVKKKGAEASKDLTQNDLKYVVSEGVKVLNETLLKDVLLSEPSDLKKYESESDASLVSEPPFAGGKYTGTTYEKIDRKLSSGNDFWPFEWVPCFDAVLAEGREKQKCYYWDGERAVTDLEEFKEMVLGDFLDSEPLDGSPLEERKDYSRKRTVIHYKPRGDYPQWQDLNSSDADQEAARSFSEVWEAWYPDTECPLQDAAGSGYMPESDSKFSSYIDIEEAEAFPLMLFVPPSVKLDDSHRICTCNSRGVMLYDVDFKQPEISCEVYHHTFKKTDLYEIVEETDAGWSEISKEYPNGSDTVGQNGGVVYHGPSHRVRATGYAPGILRISEGYVSGDRVSASGKIQVSPTKVSQYVLPFLKDSSGGISSGKVGFGEFVEVMREYYLGIPSKNSFKNIGYNFALVAPGLATTYTYSGQYEAYESKLSLTLKKKAGSSGAWAEWIGWNSPMMYVQSVETVSHSTAPDVHVYIGLKYATRVDLVESLVPYKAFASQGSKTTFGAVVGCPIWASVAKRIVYPEPKTVEEFTTDAYNVLKIDGVKDSDSLVDKDKAVWLDRSGGLGFDLFRLEVLQTVPMEDGSDKGYMQLYVVPSDSDEARDHAYFFYAEKQYDDNNKEKLAPPYVPGIAVDPENFDDKTVNMRARSGNSGVLRVAWTCVSYLCPKEALAELVVKGQHDHLLWKQASSFMSSDLLASVGKYDFDKLEAPVTVTASGSKIGFTWRMRDKKLVLEKKELDASGVKVEVGPVDAKRDDNKDGVFEVPVKFLLEYGGCSARFPKVSEGYELVSVDNAGRMAVEKDGVQFTYDYNSQKMSPSSDTKVSMDSLKHHVVDDVSSKQQVVAVMPGAYEGRKEGSKVKFEYAGQQYEVDLKGFEGKKEWVEVWETDVRKPSAKSLVGKLDPSSDYQLVKQQWDSTVETENFWWVDQSHLLELNRRFFVLKRKADDVDDWDGDRWEKLYEVRRADILDPSAVKWFCPSVYGSSASALFLSLSVEDMLTVKVSAFDIIGGMELKWEASLKAESVEIGKELNSGSTHSGRTAQLRTYGQLTAAQLLSQGEWSGTTVDGKLVLGCRLSKNFDQWAVVLDADTGTVSLVVQGYGCVGLDGSLTGGQVPSDFFDPSKGFNGKVEPVSVLLDKDGDGVLDSTDLDRKFAVGNLAELNQVDEHVVGSSEQQWYVKKTLRGIVSHLTWNGSGFSKQVIPLTNNFVASYKSPSFSNVAFGDMALQVQQIKNLMDLDGAAKSAWNTLMNASGAPCLYVFAPRKSSLAYLQQTLGQYAYVHYNSSRSAPASDSSVTQHASIDFAGEGEAEDKTGSNAQAPVLSDALTFGKQVLYQSCQLDSSSSSGMELMLNAFMDALPVIDTQISINKSQNQAAMKDVGKKYTQAALENLAGMMGSAIITQSPDSGMQSTVVGLKSLDMFYSTSDGQNVFAGPGFVEHQFVADCVAQSTVDVHIEGHVNQLSFIASALSYFQMEITAKAAELILDKLVKTGESMDNIMVCGNAVGAGMATKIPAFIAQGVKLTQQIGVSAAKAIVDVLASRGVTCTEQGRVVHHEMNSEAKHKYGEKNEVFMWPCWGVPSGGLEYSDEHVEAGVKNTPVNIALPAKKKYKGGNFFKATDETVPKYSSIQKGDKTSDSNAYGSHIGELPYYQAACYGVVDKRKLPQDMAKVEGVSHLLPNQAFKNENISASDPVFAATLIHDYIVDKDWQLSMCCTGGMVEWVSCKDTKLINGAPSNMYVNGSFCGVASPYCAVEVKRGLTKRYMRPWAVTPNVLAFNTTGYNSVLGGVLYHSFDGYSYRIVDLVGSPGLGKQKMSWLYAFQVNDRFKRSNKCPPAVLLGNFECEPVQYVKSVDKFWTVLTTISKGKGLSAGAPGEDKDVVRWSVPVFTEPVTTLPAAVKTLTAVPLVVADGVTGLATDLVSFLSEYKAPLSVDFTIGKSVYRMTEEYICSVSTQSGIDIVEDLVPALGLAYIGASPTEAYFYSKATRCYYVYTGGTSLTKMDMLERFRDVQKGYWDFVNQEVVMPCLMTYKRLNPEVEDKDTETDNVIVPVMSGSSVSGELPPPLTTVFRDRSWYKAVSLPSGFAYQGPNRVILNRSVFVEYMLDGLKGNLGKWKRLPREKYSFRRKYPEVFETVEKDVSGVEGWTHNPFVLVTSALGLDEDTDCLFEWEVTFCWPVEMDLLYGPGQMAVVNLAAETMAPGGKLVSRPTHVFLTKELFARNGAYGYYSFRYQSKNGAGNRERLHIWSDSYVAVSGLSCETKPVTRRRNEQLVLQADVSGLEEL